MMSMIKQNKGKIIVSSLIILLPILFGIIKWDDLPDTMITHWGVDGSADGFGGKAFAVFGLPIILLIGHFVCLLFTLLDKKQKEQNSKALGIVFWIIPIISLVVNGVSYQAAFGKEANLTLLIPALLGVMFILMGNYFPKIKQNRSLGIRTPWTVCNEENWNKTHRFGGKLWVASGIVILFSTLLPLKSMLGITLSIAVAIAVIPVIYSYHIYVKHQKEGIAYVVTPKGKREKVASKISAIIAVVVLLGAAVLMFTGNIEVKCEDTSIKINASFWTDLNVNYSETDSAQYRKDFDVGERTNGIGSTKLAVGTFQNEEFGSYTLYSYTDAKEYVVLTSDGKKLVIGMGDAAETKAIYRTVLEKIGE